MANDFDLKSQAFIVASTRLMSDAVKMLRRSGTAQEVQASEEALGNLVKAKELLCARLD